MSRTIAFIEARGGTPTPGSLGLLARARTIGAIDGVVCGTDAADIATMLGRYGAEVGLVLR